jgi:hypothetical protein
MANPRIAKSWPVSAALAQSWKAPDVFYKYYKISSLNYLLRFDYILNIILKVFIASHSGFSKSG